MIIAIFRNLLIKGIFFDNLHLPPLFQYHKNQIVRNEY